MYYLAEYLIYVAVASVLGALLFAASTVFVLSQEGAKYLPTASRKAAERTIRAVEASAKSSTAFINPVSSNAKRV